MNREDEYFGKFTESDKSSGMDKVFDDLAVKYAERLRTEADTRVKVVVEVLRRFNEIAPVVQEALFEYGMNHTTEEDRQLVSKAISLVNAIRKLDE